MNEPLPPGWTRTDAGTFTKFVSERITLVVYRRGLHFAPSCRTFTAADALALAQVLPIAAKRSEELADV